MSNQNDVDDFLGGGGGPNGFPEGTPIGTIVRGIVTKAEVRQSTDMETGKPKFFDDGNPMRELVVYLDTEDHSKGADDDGSRRLFAKSNMLKAIREAIKKSGAKTLEVGGKLAVKRTGQDEPKTRGFKGAWTYSAQYEAPVRSNVAVDDLLDNDGTEAF